MSPKGRDALRYALASLYWHATRRVPWKRAQRHGDWVEDNAVLRLASHFVPAGRVVPPSHPHVVMTTGAGFAQPTGTYTLTAWTPNS